MIVLKKLVAIGLTSAALVTLTSCNDSAQKIQDKIHGHDRDAKRGPGTSTDPNPTPDRPEIIENQQLSLQTFDSCQAVATMRGEFLAAQREYLDKLKSGSDPRFARGDMVSVATDDGAPQAAAESMGAEDSATNEVLTNIQEKGVDEGDFVKIGKDHIFVATGNGTIKVLDRETFAIIGSITSEPPQYASFNDLYTTDDQLIVVSTKYEQTDSPQPMPEPMPEPMALTDAYYPYPYPTTKISTLVSIYKLTKGALPELENTHTADGSVIDSRRKAKHFVLVTSTNDSVILEASKDETRCKNLYHPPLVDTDFRITNVFTFDLTAPKANPKLTGFLGTGDRVYMSQNNLYITKEYARFSYAYENDRNVFFTKLKFNDDTGAFLPVGIGKVKGYVKDVWAYKELAGGELAVATTTGHLWAQSEDQMAKNHLWVLGDSETSVKMKLLGSVNNFGPNEDIRSVRYVDQIAYVVTFKKTDPLFAIDLSNPSSPTILGELKIPGFSLYMHPAGPGRMLGVGQDTIDAGDFAWYQGILINLFDTSDPTQLKRLDYKVVGDRGSYSEAFYDHHAFFYDEAEKLMAIPVTEYKIVDNDGRDEPVSNESVRRSRPDWQHATNLTFHGVVFFKVHQDSLEEVGRVSHGTETITCNYDRNSIRRIFKFDSNYVTVSDFSISRFADPLAPVLETSYFDSHKCYDPDLIPAL